MPTKSTTFSAAFLLIRWLVCATCLVPLWVGAQTPPPPPPDNPPVTIRPEFRTETDSFRPAWGLIPSVRSPSFNYGEVNNAKLIAESSERLDFLSVNNLIVGNSDGYQVVGPNGELFFLDNIESPNCAVEIVGQQIQTNDGKSVLSNQNLPNTDSFVFIGNVNFSGCR